MATSFSVQFIMKMQAIGYQFRGHDHEPTLAHFWFQDMSGTHNFQVVYVKQPLTLSRIKDLFDGAYMMPTLFIVDSTLISEITIEEPWLKALHALYYGRVYAWDVNRIIALHHDKRADTLHSNGAIEFKKIEFREVDCWYPKFPGKFQIATFGDRAFWTPEAKQQKPPPDNAQSSYEEFWRQEFNRQRENNPNYSQKNEDVYEAFRQAFEREKSRHQETHEPPPPSRYAYAPRGDEWFNLMIAGGNLEGAKRVYRQLARENHPDTNKAPNATQIMQAINRAYEQVMEYFE